MASEDDVKEVGTDTGAHSPHETQDGSPAGPSRLTDPPSAPLESDNSATLAASATQKPAANTSSPPPASNKRQRRHQDVAGGGRRMFSMLNATLGRAKKEAEQSKTEASSRATTEARVQEKLRQQRKAIESSEAVRRALRTECERELRLTEDLLAGAAAHRSHRAQKRRLASFLVTSSRLAVAQGREARRRTDSSNNHHRVIAPSVPSALAPSPGIAQQRKDWPIYFLPKIPTMEQEDMLDDQEDRVDAEIEEADREWEQRKADLQKQIDEARAAIDRIKTQRKHVDSDTGSQQERRPQARSGSVVDLEASREGAQSEPRDPERSEDRTAVGPPITTDTATSPMDTRE